jgi:two-component system chemotaxis response regulator CheY
MTTFAAGAKGERVRPRMRTILIADDATHVRRVCKVILSEYGYCVIEAENGLAAVKRFVWHRPDVVLMDIDMPELDGLGALVQIRQHDPHARVIMVTAAAEKDKVVAAIRAGACDYVLKPFRVKQVLRVIQTLLSDPPHQSKTQAHGHSASRSVPATEDGRQTRGDDVEELQSRGGEE